MMMRFHPRISNKNIIRIIRMLCRVVIRIIRNSRVIKGIIRIRRVIISIVRVIIGISRVITRVGRVKASIVRIFRV
jgi:hypothetical protein